MSEITKNDQIGIYDSITELCEKFSNDPLKIRNLRSKCYGILLGKKSTITKKKFDDLSTDNPICNLLAWQYILSQQYKLSECSRQLSEYHDYLLNTYESENKLDTYHSILKFLLCLRDIPTVNDDQLNLSFLPKFDMKDFDALFKLPNSVICRSIDYADDTFYFKSRKKLEVLSSCGCSDLNVKVSCKKLESVESNVDTENVAVNKTENEVNIWEIAATEKYCRRRTWETYGYPEPEKEPIFLTELGDLSSLWIDNLSSPYLTKLFKNGTIIRPQIKSRKDFINDLKYLMVGMASESFTYNDFDELILIPEVSLEGITEDTLKVFCADFTFSGNCYKALNTMSLPDPYTNKYTRSGYIFAEFCESLKKYLQFYRTAVMSLSNSINILAFKEKTSHLRKQIATLASICWIGPYKKSEEMPDGVALLNYLYQKISEVTDEKIILVLYSILFPCCQIYFGQFILHWLLDGSFHDPYGEFFIRTNYKFHSTRGRTYWTRTFTILEDLIPDFLLDLKDDILLCGKMLNLLKLCHPFSKLCVYLMGKKPQIVSCCITRNQLLVLKQNAEAYFLDATEFCGPKLSLAFILQKDRLLSNELIDCISKKRAATLKRIELERQKNVQEEYEKKLEARALLKEQYDMALQQKQFETLQDIECEIKLIETNIQIERRRNNLIQHEAKDMIEYYEQLFKISDERREQIEKRIEILKYYQLDPTLRHPQIESKYKETKTSETTEIQDSTPEIKTVELEEIVCEISEPEMHSSKSLDELNANLHQPENKEDKGNNNTENETPVNDNFKQKLENFEIAKRNKLRVMNEELGIGTEVITSKQPKLKTNNLITLTDAQRNKIKVMSSEFNVAYKPRQRIDKELTIADINKFRVMSSTVFSDEIRTSKETDNENNTNKNIENKITNIQKNKVNDVTKIKKSLSLNLKKPEKTSQEIEKCLPMSVDSTPLSEIATVSTSTFMFGEDRLPLVTGSTTAGTEKTDDGGFNFNANYAILEPPPIHLQRNVFSKTCSAEDVKNIKPMCLKMFLSNSLSYPLIVQIKLVSNELLRYFVEDLNYLQHLKNFKKYFMLQDGEFAKSATDSLFQKLYGAKLPIQLINCRTLNYIIHGALEDTKRTEGLNNLSFKINYLPENFNLADIEVLGCLSLTYKVEWPLNILLPSDAIGKYNEIFKFLLRIYRMQWVLKTIFMDLRMLVKEIGEAEHDLVISEHYRRIHQFRHVMTHFIQTLQGYINGEVLQTHWAKFEKSLENVTNIDELYEAHTHYIKNVLFMCLLNQRSAPLKAVFDKIFTVILKFHDNLRSKNWNYANGTFSHSNYDRLASVFQNFIDLVRYLFKVGKKVVKNGYQPHFRYFLDALNTNDYYSKIIDP